MVDVEMVDVNEDFCVWIMTYRRYFMDTQILVLRRQFLKLSCFKPSTIFIYFFWHDPKCSSNGTVTLNVLKPN